MHANRLLLFPVLLAAFTATANADVIYGTIKLGSAPLADHELKITCANVPYPAKTDARGSYSVKLEKKGRCTLSFTHQGNELSCTVYSQDKPARYDLVVVSENNKWILRRK